MDQNAEDQNADRREFDFFLKQFLSMQWLRPEVAPWDTHAALLVYRHLRTNCSKLEVGIGNGYTSFTTLGGEFSPDYDWYYNIDPSGFWDNRDIYDAASFLDLDRFIVKRPDHPYTLALDHKQTLIDQAAVIGVAARTLVADANALPELGQFGLIYSNMLYWLADPVAALTRLARALAPGGQLIVMMPTPKFPDYARSYKRENRLWTLINRGRADCIQAFLAPETVIRAVETGSQARLAQVSLYLSAATLKFWDIGLRPVSPYLIHMANSMPAPERAALKQRWCADLLPLLTEVAQDELKDGARDGAFAMYRFQRG